MARPRKRSKAAAPKTAATKTATTKPSISERWIRGGWRTTALLFAVALVLRLLFWQATPDSAWPHSAFYKGDAPTWVTYAWSLQTDQPFELGLPIRPPGNGYLLSWLWDGSPESLGGVKAVWCVLGALAVALFHRAAFRMFGPGIALGVGLWCALSSGLMVLSTSLNNETPYLVLVAATFALWPRLRESPSMPGLVGWGVLHALGCLVRVEHALVFGLTTVHLGWLWWRGETRRAQPVVWRGAAVSVAFALALAPWHAVAWEACRDFNRVEPATNPATEQAFQRVEAAIQHIAWDDGARDARELLPAAVRRTLGNFVAATVLVRGGDRVTADDFQILQEAFGYVPEPLGEHPFVALYGGLNFHLANHPDAPAGFSRGPLDTPPPLDGGITRFPAPLVAGLPPPDLALTYPPHLRMINRGYGLGLAWILDDPTRFVGHAWGKLRTFWDGAALGFSGHNLPWGFDGTRHRVDMAVPDRHGGVVLWQLLLFVGTCVGLARARRRPELVPWAALLATKFVVTVAFFGYARQGATAIPVVALACFLALEGRWPARLEALWARRATWILGALLGAGVLVEGVRYGVPPTVHLDDRPVGVEDPWTIDRHEDRRVTLRR